jgi:hypothetical protein
MGNKTLAEKGYTLEVTSWENDADNYKTESMVFDTEDEAKKIAKMCKDIFCSGSNGKGGIGNFSEGEGERARDIVLEYLDENQILENQDGMTDDEKFENAMEINRELLGYSEYYYARVFESAKLFYSPETLVLKTISL